MPPATAQALLQKRQTLKPVVSKRALRVELREAVLRELVAI